MDLEGDNQVSKDELLQFFDGLREKRSYFNAEDLREHLLRGRSDYVEGDAPTADRLLKGLFNNELGSAHQGAKVGESAPDFTLATHDGGERIQLSKQFGVKAYSTGVWKLYLWAFSTKFAGGRRYSSALSGSGYLYWRVCKRSSSNGWLVNDQ